MTNLQKSAPKIIWTLSAAQGLFSTGAITAFAVGAIVAVDLGGGNPGWTGVPGTLMLVGAAAFASVVGRIMDSFGRRVGLTLSYALSSAGLLIAGFGAVQASLIMFLLGVLLFGFGRGGIELSRYAAAEVSELSKRGRAISIVVLSGVIGSIAGPPLITLSNTMGQRFGLPDLSGPWFIGAVCLMLGTLLVFALLRPDPSEIARQMEVPDTTLPTELVEARSFGVVLQDKRTKLSILAMILGQVAMVIVMTITPIHMRGLEHEIGAISLVLTAHTLGMFGLSLLSGYLADSIGRVHLIFGGGIILVAACALAPLADTVVWLSFTLFMLGLGWNFTFVGGSAMLDDVLRISEKGKIQGIADALVKVASGFSGLGSGLLFSRLGYDFTSWGTIILAIVIIAAAIFWRPQHVDVVQPAGQAAD